jgi:cell division protein FtsN
MKASYKLRAMGFLVVLVLGVGVAMLVLHPKKRLAKESRMNENTHPVVLLPLINEEVKTNRSVEKNQKIDSSSSSATKVESEQSASKLGSIKNPVALAVAGSVHGSHIRSQSVVQLTIFLQVASYSSLENADAMRSQLDSLGYLSRIKLVRIDKKNWYRLSVGPFKDKSQASVAQQAIEKRWKLKPKMQVALID